ncbi:hypothetical protein PSHT_05676 [Puccinia striiformis]|uniref:Uncharacterized protein n=1 Tax=Puccinia striiformis TaxID=27350 RepID=A0A2S4W9V9_9BASI|nr:hypothetical protein PSHT_05676 [Puccinia striiformis]
MVPWFTICIIVGYSLATGPPHEKLALPADSDTPGAVAESVGLSDSFLHSTNPRQEDSNRLTLSFPAIEKKEANHEFIIDINPTERNGYNVQSPHTSSSRTSERMSTSREPRGPMSTMGSRDKPDNGVDDEIMEDQLDYSETVPLLQDLPEDLTRKKGVTYSGRFIQEDLPETSSSRGELSGSSKSFGSSREVSSSPESIALTDFIRSRSLQNRNSEIINHDRRNGIIGIFSLFAILLLWATLAQMFQAVKHS